MNWLGIGLLVLATWLGWREHQFLNRAAMVSGKVLELAPARKGWQAVTVEYVIPDNTTRTLRRATLQSRARFGRFEVGGRVRVAYIVAADGTTDARVAGFSDCYGWAYSWLAIGLLFLFLHAGFRYGNVLTQYAYPFAQGTVR